MTPLEWFAWGVVSYAIASAALLHVAGRLTARVHAARERRRMDQEVRLGFVRLAANMRQADQLARRKHDMPWTDRVREVQVGQVVTLGVTVRKAVA
jgi:hypothetical protein